MNSYNYSRSDALQKKTVYHDLFVVYLLLCLLNINIPSVDEIF